MRSLPGLHRNRTGPCAPWPSTCGPRALPCRTTPSGVSCADKASASKKRCWPARRPGLTWHADEHAGGRISIGLIPHGHWKTLTFLAGLRHDRIVAPCVIDGPVNGLSFTTWVSQFLAPTPSRGDIVIAGNLGSHKGRSVRAALRAASAKLFFLPACSPDLNPIGMVVAKLKTLLRKADERSVKATWRRIGDQLSAFTAKECAAYLRHAGYASATA